MTARSVAVATLLVLGILLLAYLLAQVLHVLLIVFLGILVASAIEPLVNRLRRGSVSRGQGVLVTYSAIAALVALLALLIVPPMMGQVSDFVEHVPELLRGGYTVYPVNPSADEVLGRRAYPSLRDLPEVPEVVEFVTPPEVTERVLEDCAALGIELVWLQPGAGSEAAARFCREHGIAAIDGACLMHERRYRRVG